MTAPLTSPQDYRCQVLENRDCGHHLKLLRLRTLAGSAGNPDFACLPGQFVMVDLPDERFFFRRPFSVLDVPDERTMDLYYKVVGQGTAMMADWAPGFELNVLGPLGIGFTPPATSEKAVYVGGGIGIAPLYFLAKGLNTPGHCFYGVRSASEIGLEPELKKVFGKHLHISTDDGSAGFAGRVDALLTQQAEVVQTAETAYVCGPTPMMRAVSERLYELNPNIRVQVSLEEHMPCGTGACTGCVVHRADQVLPSKVCLEGPVFDARAIAWQHPIPQPPIEEGACPL